MSQESFFCDFVLTELFRLIIDGVPIRSSDTTAIGQSFMPESLKDILDKVGLIPSRWF